MFGIDDALAGLGTVGQAVLQALLVAGETVAPAAQVVVTGLGNFGTGIGNALGTVGTTLGEAFEPVTSTVAPLATQIGEAGAQVLPDALPGVPDIGPITPINAPIATPIPTPGAPPPVAPPIGPPAPFVGPPTDPFVGPPPPTTPPGIWNQIGSGLENFATKTGDYIAEHPLKAAGETTSAYQLLRSQFKLPQATAVSPREKPPQLQAPHFGAQVNRAIASPLDRFRSMLGGR